MDERSKPNSIGEEKDRKSRPSSKTNKRENTGSPKSPKSKSPKSKSPAAKKGRKKSMSPSKKQELETATPKIDPPEGCVSLFLSSKTQELFQCKTDDQVTKDDPNKLIGKEDIILDIKARAAVSDFHPIKPAILDYPGDEILLVYDYDYIFGNNFYIALTEEAKELILSPPKPEDEQNKEDEEPVVYRYIPPVSKPWISQGSENEIAEESLIPRRSTITMTFIRKRKDFGAPIQFKDRNVGDVKDGFIECTPYEDNNYSLHRKELDKPVQAIPQLKDFGAQTIWRYPKNAWTQYEPRAYDDDEKSKEEEEPKYVDFITSVQYRFEKALQQNEIMDVFCDDWAALGDDSLTAAGKGDHTLKEYQSFTDLKYSKDKTVTWIDWHPTLKGVVAVSVGEQYTFDERANNLSKVILRPSLIMIWSFMDPIHPQLLLEAPDDIACFKFRPTNPNHVAGGCMNGQLILWDITQYEELLKSTRRKKDMTRLPGFEDKNALEIPIMRWAAVSSIETSHRTSITDLLWIPDHMELNRLGVPTANTDDACVQIFTSSTDTTVLVWDIRPPKVHTQDKIKHPMGVPDTFKYLDLTWKPMMKITLYKAEPGGDHAPTRISIQEVQGDRSVLATGTTEKDHAATTTGEFQIGNVTPSAKNKRTLQGVQTRFYVGTEDGELVYVDWLPVKDSDSGKIQTPKPDFYSQLHDGPIVSLERSPYFKDIVLVIGGWTFSIWKEGVNSGPILQCAAAESRLSAGCWSLSRPSVFFLAKEDGSVDIWDLLDRTHERSLTQTVASHPLTFIKPKIITSRQHLIALGDLKGTLYVMEVPSGLREQLPNELEQITAYLNREVARRKFVVKRWDMREEEKRQLEQEAKRKAGIAPQAQLTDEEIEYKRSLEYKEFCDDEQSFLRELGLKEEELEELPPMD